MIYLDTSAMAKLLISESETPDLQTWLTEQRRQGEQAATSALGRIELLRTAARHGQPGLRERALHLLDGLDILPITAAVIALAETIGPPTLRSLDAIHLASSSQIAEELTVFVAYDTRLLDGAKAVGFPTRSPGVIQKT
ncbi:VapC toxin family PIN domain ribonuclease [Mycobacteroides chelonae]|uniref:type II toxin-antitoxin system VapC family toxin n=1 Tax=Mycobacteroides TaxID=670516 RepID=UPI0008A98505|nr:MULTISPECIES: type II toxin-antitoxin system VapC family toxin [Mycobacteroides]OHT95587.1 VapC toxin family PIN domain ribonuclease [Mycobacteroides chelonae]TKV35338.1 VapC toxin family PIN domain ribonuclease [Mycobacteroides abscessus subsp. bolletii]